MKFLAALYVIIGDRPVVVGNAIYPVGDILHLPRAFSVGHIGHRGRKFDRHVADRYDHATGGHYFDIVVGLYFDGLLTEDDIARLDETTQQEIAKIELINKMMWHRK